MGTVKLVNNLLSPIRWTARVTIVLTTLILASQSSHSIAKDQNIHALRSAYLYYFSHFIQWPDETVFSGNKLNLCALTNNENDIFQLNTINNKVLGEYTLNIVLLKNNETGNLGTCHILYISGAKEKELLSETTNIKQFTLTVTEGNQKNRGAIHLYMQGKKLKFEINNELLTEKQFKASSKLLRLSRKEKP